MNNNELTKIYVCSPYRATSTATTVENTISAADYCEFVINTVSNALPIAPHIYFPQFMDDSKPNERKLALEIGKRLLAECKEIWVFGYFISDGMAAEITEAARLRIPIRWFTEDCRERAIEAAEPQEVKEE